MKELTKVHFTNLDKILYPDLEITKAQVVEYYIRIAPRMLSFLKNRTLVRTRYPDGIDKEGFYEKDSPKGSPEWVKTFTKFSETSQKDTDYVICNDVDTLLWLANLAALELHIPLSKIPKTNAPDLLLFDLDPELPAGINEAVQTTFILKELLDGLGLKSYVKNSGKKGLHIIIPLIPQYSFDETKNFVHRIGEKLASKHGFIVSERKQTNIPGKVLIDYPQNSERSTMIAPYSLRATREATVSTPLEWTELTNLNPFNYNIFNLPKRETDPWKHLFDEPQKLPKID
ncbi:non-homologous end-joining DNA ligase [Candidatus Bathyarchaeota archaeon]|nr:non-homologous end-joining DNA ligase [Candidatus Bathyarchaeota archaeon]